MFSSRTESWLKRLCAVGLILLMQGPAMLVQEVAWANMLASYTREKGVARGVVETFDGEHPCELCHKATELRSREGRNDPKNSPQAAKAARFTWGEMAPAKRLVIPPDFGRELPREQAVQPPARPGRGGDSPAIPPPEAA